MPTFKTEKFSAIATEITDALASTGVDLEIERYAKVDAAGSLRVFTARDGDELLGFAIFTVSVHPHHRTELWGFVDKMWIAETVRHTSFDGHPLATHLLADSERSLHREGVIAIRGAASADEEAVYRSLGYEAVEIIFERRTTAILDS